jgi:hypothetical protein
MMRISPLLLPHLPPVGVGIETSEKAVCALKTRLIFGDEPLEMMTHHPEEDGPLRMPGSILSRTSLGVETWASLMTLIATIAIAMYDASLIIIKRGRNE